MSDGTPSGTLALTDESSLSIDSGLFPVESHVLFFVSEIDKGEALWSSDGTVAGTVPVRDLTKGHTTAIPGVETIFNGRLFFSAGGDPDGSELWTSDGTAAGTFMVADLLPGWWGSNPHGLAVFGGKLPFFADTVPAGLAQLWSSDGTAAGTQIALNLDGDQPPIVAGDRMYLFAAAPDAAPGLWVSDGTAAGTRFLMPAPNNGEIPPVAVGGRLFFAGPGATSEVSRLWTSDGTVEGTRPVRDRDGNEVLNPVTLRAFAGRLVVGTLIGGNETLWESNGTDAGTLAILTLPSNPQWPQKGPRTELAVTGCSSPPTIRRAAPSCGPWRRSEPALGWSRWKVLELPSNVIAPRVFAAHGLSARATLGPVAMTTRSAWHLLCGIESAPAGIESDQGHLQSAPGQNEDAPGQARY